MLSAGGRDRHAGHEGMRGVLFSGYLEKRSEKSFVSRKDINVESNYVTLLIDRGQDGGCVIGVLFVPRLALRLF